MDPRLNQKLNPRAELLVFNKKEITVLIMILVLVAAFSFTAGLRVGKSLSQEATQAPEKAPLAEKAKPQEPARAEEGATKPAGEETESSNIAEKPKEKEERSEKATQTAEDQADAEFAGEVSREKVRATKPVAMSLPSEKKGEVSDGPRYTLQVGSHRTVAEAAEQVSTLKHEGLDAFYLEAKVRGKGTWYRVAIGLFNSKEQAETTAVKWQIAKKPLPSYIVQKINE